MVKEVETYNNTEVLDSGLALNFETFPEIITGVLTSNGLVLTMKVNRLMAPNSVRKVALYYMLPILERQMIAEYPIGTFGPSNVVDENTEYVFDLTPVMTRIVHTAPEQVADDTITVRLFTYEANITTAYGSKTLHVPYKVSYPSSMISPLSTDGWYALRVIDTEEYSAIVNYVVGDVVFYSTGNFICIKDSLNNPPTNPIYWEAISEEVEHGLYEFGAISYTAIPTLINSNILLTRYIKQKHIYEFLTKTNFKRYDNIPALMSLEKIVAMREAAVAHMRAGNPIAARYMLDMISIEVNSSTVKNGNKNIVEIISNYTI
jgi:hypothetical protein